MRRPKLPPPGPVPPPFTPAQIEAAAEVLSIVSGDVAGWRALIARELAEAAAGLPEGGDGALIACKVLRPPLPAVRVELAFVAGCVSARVDGEPWGLVCGTDADLRRPPGWMADDPVAPAARGDQIASGG